MAGEWLVGKSPSVSTKSTLTPEQQQIMSLFLGALAPQIGKESPVASTLVNGRWVNTATGKYTPDNKPATEWTPGLNSIEAYSGDITPGMQDINQMLKTVLSGKLSGAGPESDMIKGLISKFSGSSIPEFSFNAETFNPDEVADLFNATVKNPAMESWDEDILPSIAEKFAGRNAFDSGATVHEMVKAGRGLESDLFGQLQTMLSTAREGTKARNLQGKLSTDSTNAGLRSTGYGTNASAITNLVNQLVGEGSNQFNTALGGMLSLGSTEQGIATSKGQEEYQKWATEQPYNNPYLQMIMGALGLQTQQSVVNPGSAGLLPTIISGGSKVLSNIL